MQPREFVNRFAKSMLGILSVLALLVSSAPPVAAAELRDDLWSDEFWVGGFNDDVLAVAEDGLGNFYVAGWFTAIDGETLPNDFGPNIAMWDGSAWTHIDFPLGISVGFLAPDGQGNIIAGGQDGASERVPLQESLALWDGQSWTNLTEDLTDFSATDVAVKPNGEIVASFKNIQGPTVIQKVMSWSGSEWTELLSTEEGSFPGIKIALGTDGTLYTASKATGVSVGDPTGALENTDIRQLIVDGGGVLYATGNTTTLSHGLGPEEFWTWGGTSWLALPVPYELSETYYPTGRRLILDHDGSLLATGKSSAKVWNGTTWEELLSVEAGERGLFQASLYGDKLVFTGEDYEVATAQGNVEVAGPAIWSDGQWELTHRQESGNGLAGNWIQSAAVDANGHLFVTGGIRPLGVEEGPPFIWDGESWAGAPGLSGSVSFANLLATPEGEIIAAHGDALYKWNLNQFEPLGSLGGGVIDAIDADGMGGVVAFGRFTSTIDGTALNNIARWNGTSWEPLGAGIDLGGQDWPQEFYTAANDSGDVFVANGAGRLRHWNGSVWTNHDSSNSFGYNGIGFDSDGDLLAAGVFDDGVSGLATWDGTTWKSTGPGLGNSVNSFTENSCGELLALNGAGISKLSDAGIWERVASAQNSLDLLTSGGDVYVTLLGRQNVGNEIAQDGLARWSDPDWNPVESAQSISAIVNACDYDQEAHANVLRLYRAFFDREPDVGGAKYWIDINAQGQTLDQIAEYFTQSQEFANNYAGTTDQQYLEAVYQNVLGREYDQAGFDYWLGLLQTGELTRGGVVRWVAANQEFINKAPYQP